MRQIVDNGWVRTLLLIACWRGMSELLERRRALAASGVLQRRIDRRRALRIDRAVAAAGFSRARARRVPVAVTTGPAVDHAVHVGSTGSYDLDDVGLLEAAMRRAARDRQGVDARGLTSRPRPTDWGGLLERATEVTGRAANGAKQLAPPWTVVAGVAGVVLTFLPLLRPLADAAPWLAAGGFALVLAAVIGSRRS